MTPDAQSKRGSFNTFLIAVADALLVAVIAPLAIYLVKSMIELKTELAAIKLAQVTRTEFIDKGTLIRNQASELREELTKLRAEVAIINARLERADERKK